MKKIKKAVQLTRPTPTPAPEPQFEKITSDWNKSENYVKELDIDKKQKEFEELDKVRKVLKAKYL